MALALAPKTLLETRIPQWDVFTADHLLTRDFQRNFVNHVFRRGERPRSSVLVAGVGLGKTRVLLVSAYRAFHLANMFNLPNKLVVILVADAVVVQQLQKEFCELFGLGSLLVDNYDGKVPPPRAGILVVTYQGLLHKWNQRGNSAAPPRYAIEEAAAVLLDELHIANAEQRQNAWNGIRSLRIGVTGSLEIYDRYLEFFDATHKNFICDERDKYVEMFDPQKHPWIQVPELTEVLCRAEGDSKLAVLAALLDKAHADRAGERGVALVYVREVKLCRSMGSKKPLAHWKSWTITGQDASEDRLDMLTDKSVSVVYLQQTIGVTSWSFADVDLVIDFDPNVSATCRNYQIAGRLTRKSEMHPTRKKKLFCLCDQDEYDKRLEHRIAEYTASALCTDIKRTTCEAILNE